jgi:hypothetical protein
MRGGGRGSFGGREEGERWDALRPGRGWGSGEWDRGGGRCFGGREGSGRWYVLRRSGNSLRYWRGWRSREREGGGGWDCEGV